MWNQHEPSFVFGLFLSCFPVVLLRCSVLSFRCTWLLCGVWSEKTEIAERWRVEGWNSLFPTLGKVRSGKLRPQLAFARASSSFLWKREPACTSSVNGVCVFHNSQHNQTPERRTAIPPARIAVLIQISRRSVLSFLMFLWEKGFWRPTWSLDSEDMDF